MRATKRREHECGEHECNIVGYAERSAIAVAVSLAFACSSGEKADSPAGPQPTASIPETSGDAGSLVDAASLLAADRGSDGSDAGSSLPPPTPATSLPLEILGAPGTAVEASILLDAADVDAAITQGGASLALTVHNVVEPDSAKVSLNDASPIDLGDPKGPFLRRFRGDVASGAIALSPDALRAGPNRLVFRYTRQLVDVAAVSGFRVLDAAIVIGDKRVALSLPVEDPSTWAPLDPSAAAIERGRGFFQDVSRDDGPACARCHADSGADLQYYAFSTNSIVERAKFHKFSESEAEDIASYIRSLPLSAVGRPYDSPFQPGPNNHGAAGAGHAAILADDAAFANATYSATQLPADIAWNFAEAIDTFLAPAAIATPTWMRWLPRQLNDDWFTRLGGVLGSAERALASDPSLPNAQTFMSAALSVGKDVLVQDGDYEAKIDVLRFAAVKLWDWSRKNGFDSPDHGVPDGSPAYPYEVGFAFFEAAQSMAVPGSATQTMQWWWAQLATNPGRGLSTGERPLNFEDVLSAAENAALGAEQIAFLHLYGSWEESRGSLASQWGTAEAPVRLLTVPMRALSASDRASVLKRFLLQEAQFVSQGGVIDSSHHAKLADAWSRGCPGLSTTQIAALRAVAPEVVQADLTSCP